ncbi:MULTISPECIES: YopX family protein [Brevibacillus]|uniref:Phage protein n=1 Tax=Brevibacillus borstelensis AK1 TaxID=1300222 RepID=M8E093_9BACL|nr:YopX family protein [Brevibacillus borstelensis]EMT52711.1 Phage protein [Brevibacillus borstelensis AK1]MCM3472598.1 YopX family protein [Brevibacillus borstelensis]MCM3625501.1 YopX family protein [Brevibacillus borstelensis]MED1885728.1 YopX family protein [Brevibacillus borstelensis]MED2011192.1 YopX family protein [Brevibacillus borstelensis]
MLQWKHLVNAPDLSEFLIHNVEDGHYSTLMQFTGLCDKNGKEIYEGDVCLLFNKGSDLFGEEPVVVEWIGEDETGYGIGWGVFPSMFEYVVIGNIYENPELLEVGK